MLPFDPVNRLQFLEKTLQSCGVEEGADEELWAPLFTYRNGLQQGEGAGEMAAPPRPPPSRRGRGRRRPAAASLVEEESAGQWSVAKLSTPAAGRGPGGPLTSTVIRRKRPHEEVDAAELDFDV